MNITIFGSTGRVGSEILKRALQDGQHVTALVRIPSNIPPQPNLTIIKGDILNPADVSKAITHADAVISAIGTDKTTTLSDGLPHIIRAMRQQNIKRIVTIGTAGILDSRVEQGKLRYQSSESKRTKTFAAEEHEKAFHALEASDLDWTIACPTYLPDGEVTGIYRVEKNKLPQNGEKITVGDTAHFVYEELLQRKYNQLRVGLAY